MINENKFEQLSSQKGFMKHNGGLLFRNLSDSDYSRMIYLSATFLYL